MMDEPTIKYGKERMENVLDDNGSTMIIDANVRNKEYVKPIRKHYEWRERVKTKHEELAQVIKFYKDMQPHHKDVAIRIETSKTGQEKGYWDVVFCYTIVEY
jgi:hypothetical protein